MKPLEEYFASLRVLLQLVPLPVVAEMIDALHAARMRAARVYVIGSNGSAATVAHFAGDLAETTEVPGRPSFKVVALTDKVLPAGGLEDRGRGGPLLADRLASLVSTGDVVIAISGRGEAPEVVDAATRARDAGAVAIAMTGFAGGKLVGVAAHALVVPTARREQIEDVHLAVQHAICRMLLEKAEAGA